MSITQAQANTGAYNAPKIQGTAIKPNFTQANGGSMIMSFLDMVQSKVKAQPVAVSNNAKTSYSDKSDKFDKADKSLTDLNKTDEFSGLDRIRKSNPDDKTADKVKERISKILNRDENETDETTGNGTADILKLFEMLGVPQDIAQQMYDYFTPDTDSGGNFVMGFVNLTSQTAENEMIPEDIRKILSDISDRLQTALTDAGAIIKYDGKNIISAEENADLFQQPGTDFFSMLKTAVSNYLSEKGGQITTVTANSDQNPNNTVDIISISETDGQANITQNAPQTTTAIEEMYKAMKKTTIDLRNAVTGIKSSDIGEVVLSQLLTDEQGEKLETTYASNLSLTTDEAAAILDKDPKTAASALSMTQNTADINKLPDSMHNLFNYALAGILNTENNAAQTVQTSDGGNVAKTLEEISHIIANNIKNGVGMNTTGDANKINTGGFELKMTLSPKELGELLIKVSYVKGNVELSVVTTNKAAEAGILNRIGDLKESLSLRGINLTDVEVNGGNLDYGGQSSYSNENAHTQNGRNQNHGSNAFGRLNGVNSGQNSDLADSFETINKEAARHEIVMNYVRSQRLLYKTI